jgi:hypothetical protein
VGLCAAVDTLKQEKAQITTDREADVAAQQIFFHDYRVGHHKRLRVNLEKAVNEIGAWCLPYPRKRSTISEIIMWFDKEIRALPNAIAKANKNFLVYCLVGVLKMIYEHAKRHHIDGLDAIMSLCNASILDEIPDEIARLAVRIVKRWRASHGLPYVTDAFCIESEVRIFVACCGV